MKLKLVLIRSSSQAQRAEFYLFVLLTDARGDPAARPPARFCRVGAGKLTFPLAGCFELTDLHFHYYQPARLATVEQPIKMNILVVDLNDPMLGNNRIRTQFQGWNLLWR